MVITDCPVGGRDSILSREGQKYESLTEWAKGGHGMPTIKQAGPGLKGALGAASYSILDLSP
jgi:hypothetical protein